ncbi:Signal transduction histidine kinase [Pedobacter sp. ok626]|uniref:hybrid sensor histidine kinase/response regulator transcription factor n=1 Tax=Pedobacter sp. ok626 TaxID=1761882 RepID=UPI00088CF6CE|nr:two-component regulator propeller domain-containing protein [Pedobacter sp. ok626]SDK26441.1 Signal transduction histidine kinase [Pedobacter sp. ok626]
MRATLFIVFFLLSFSSYGRQDATTHVVPELLFNRFLSRDGLPDNRVRSLFQDSRGHLWVGTMNGVARYDGYDFKKYYHKNNTSGISGNWTFAICEDSNQNIWIGTLNGLNFFDTKKEKFTSFKSIPNDSKSLFSNKITALHFDPSGKLWVGTQDGLARFNPATGKFEKFSQFPFNTYINKIIKSVDDHIWIGTAAGVVRYNTRTDISSFYELKVKPDSYGNYFWSMLENNGDLYVATAAQGLIRLSYNARAGKYEQFDDLNFFLGNKKNLSNTEVFDLCKTSNGDLWLATDGGLASIEKPGTTAARFKLYKNNPLNNQSLSHNTVYQVFIDRTNNLWCGTEMGLNKLNLQMLPFQYFTFQNRSAEDEVRSVFTRDGQNIWIGTAKNALYSYNLLRNTTLSYRMPSAFSSFNAHRSLFIDASEHVYTGTLGGASLLNQQNPALSKMILAGGAVFAFLKDSKGNLWLGKNDGLLQIKPDGSTVTYQHNQKDPGSFSSAFVRSLYEDHKGMIWVGFESLGLNLFNPETGRFIRVLPDASGKQVTGNIIYSIVEHPQNVIWAGSESGLSKLSISGQKDGVYQYKIKNYLESDGLSDKAVNGILPEKGKILWISSLKGLMRFDMEKEKFEHYLPMLSFSSSSAFKYNEHQLLFGTSDGLLIFDPDMVSRRSIVPEVLISELKIFNHEVGIDSVVNGDVILKETVARTKELSLSHKNNVFTLGFTGLHFSDPANMTYAYKMEGFDKDWIYVKANERSVTYTNLDPGTYYFKVKAGNNMGVWNEKPAVLKINVLPPPWKTWWAITSYIMLVSVSVVLVFKYMKKQTKQKNAFETERLLRLKDKNIHQEQLDFFTNITHELQTPLTLINGSIERVIYRSSHLVDHPKEHNFLSIVHQQSSRLTYLVNQLLDFRKAEAGHLESKDSYFDISGLLVSIGELFVSLCDDKNLEYAIEVEAGIVGWMDRDKLEKVIFNLLSNAFKHSDPDQKIIFSVTRNSAVDQLVIEIKNSGCQLSELQLSKIFDQFFVVDGGQSDHYSNGIGLAFTRQLVHLLKGDIQVVNDHSWICFTTILALSTRTDHEDGAEPSTHTASYLLRAITANTDSETKLSTKENNKRSLMEELGQVEKKTILIVEDESAIRYLLKDVLEENYILYEAENGRAAIELLKFVSPNLIISDVMMPDIDGLEFCAKVKNSPDTCHIPFILLSARTAMEQKTEGYDAGADAYIPKPFDTMHLLVRVKKLLEYRERLHDIFKKDGAVISLGEKNLVDADKQFLNQLVEIIESNIEDINLDATYLESKLALSRMQLYRKLKSLSNMTPPEFIKHIRLQRTVLLLQNTQLTISEIFYRSGFNNQSYFFREFKKRYKCSPSEYRQQQRIHI